MKTKKPKIAITVGDPAGIGPEITLKAIQSKELHQEANLLVIGSEKLLQEQAKIFLGSPLSLNSGFEILDVPLPEKSFAMGQISAACGEASYAYLQKAVELGRSGKVDAIVTAPIHKESWKAGGVPHIGHTEALSALLGGRGETLFVVGKLRIFFLTRHVSLSKAIQLISIDNVLSLLRHAKEALGWLGIDNPRIAVAGLNPHAGDGGMFGDEEITKLGPAVEAAKQEGINAFGPVGADSVFHQCAQGQYDAVISLYHDQGHIAAKTLDFMGTVSVTTGLSVLRTSVDHGTAFDIAGKNLADPASMVAAIKLTAELVKGRASRRK